MINTAAKIFSVLTLTGMLLLVGMSVQTISAATNDAYSIEPHEKIYAAIKSFLEPGETASRKTQLGTIDPRIKLTYCESPLQVEFPVGARQTGYSTVSVECHSPKKWKIHVPVHIKQYAKVLVTKQTLPRGHRLQASDFRLEKRDTSRLTNGYYKNTNEISGLILKRGLGQAKILTPSMVETPRIIRRGDTVTISANSGGLAIHVKGKALMDGRIGDKIRIENIRSKKKIQGIVTGPGEVEINM